ncbi:MAG: single-stranded DNA-binding protein [Euzebya sp.]
MSAPNSITVAGNLTAKPEPRTTSSEVNFTRMRIAVNRRRLVAETNQWEDRVDGFFDVVCWRDMARHAAASLTKGDRVVVTGRLSRREYEVASPGGGTETRHVIEIEADEVGASLRWTQWQRLDPRPLNVVEPRGPASLAEDTSSEDEDQDAELESEDVAPAA